MKIREHRRELKNSYVSFTMGSGIITKIIWSQLLIFTAGFSFSFASEIKLGLGKSPETNQNGVALNVEYIGNSLDSVFGLYPFVGTDKNLNGYTSSAYTGLVLKKFLDHNFLVEISFGGAAHDGPLKKQKPGKRRRTMGSRILFRESLSVGYIFKNQHNISLFIDHISNASIVRPNSGVTNMGVRYGIPLEY